MENLEDILLSDKASHKRQMLYDSAHMKYLVKFTEKKRMVVARDGSGEGRRGNVRLVLRG